MRLGKRNLRNCLPSFLIICLVQFALSTAHSDVKQSDSSFSFVDISDSYTSPSDKNRPFKYFVSDILSSSNHPAFVCDTGSLTWDGSAEEYNSLKTNLQPLSDEKISFYPVLGNRDVRWCGEAKKRFQTNFGPLYYSVNYKGFHFIFLDTTQVLEQQGHFDDAEMVWLQHDLSKLLSTTPVFIFLHHTIGTGDAFTREIDNEFSLRKLLPNHNIIAIFTSASGDTTQSKTDGIETLSLGKLSSGSYYSVNVSSQLVTISISNLDRSRKQMNVTEIPVAQTMVSVLRAGWDDPDNPFLFRRRPAALLDPRSPSDSAHGENADYRIDGDPWQPLTQNARDIWETVFYPATIPVGVHTCDIKLITSNHTVLESELILEIERTHQEPTDRWAINLGDGIQSSPVLANNVLLVSCLDGYCYGISVETGKILWKFHTDGAIVGAPCAADKEVIFTSEDGFIYCLESQSGHLKWKYNTHNVLLSTPTVSTGVVCVGGHRAIYGLDLKTGKKLWEYRTNSFFEDKPAADENNFYLGGWDNTLYAIDSQTGMLRWQQKLGSDMQSSPAVSSPVVSNGTLYVCSNDGILHAFEASTGKVLWTSGSPDTGDRYYSTPSVMNGVLYIAGKDSSGDIYALNASTGKIIWKNFIGQEIVGSSPTLSPDGQTMAIMGFRGDVAVLNTSTGKTVWKYALGPGNIYSSPAYDGSVVYTTTMADDVQALNAPGVGAPPPIPARW